MRAPVHQLHLNTPIEMSYRYDSPMPGAQFHSHAFYEIYYFQGGECNYIIGDKLMALKPGDLILMHGMTLHCSNPSPHVPYVRSIIHFDPSFLTNVLQPEAASSLLRPFEELRNIRLSLQEDQQTEMEMLLSQLYRMYSVRRAADATAHADRFMFQLLDLLTLIKSWCQAYTSTHEQEHSSLKERHVQSVVSYLETHYAEEMTLGTIADALHLTKPYLSNLFKEVTGTTVFKYLYNRRLNQAKMMFRLEPHIAVSEVSKAVGFHHLAHFSRLFKAAVGESPEQYRRRMAAQAAMAFKNRGV